MFVNRKMAAMKRKRRPRRSMALILVVLFMLCIASRRSTAEALNIGWNGPSSSNKGNNNNKVKLYEEKQLRDKNIRVGVKVLLATYGGLMLRGKMAFESLLISMVATKLIHTTSEESSGQNFGWALVSWLSFFFAGTASTFGWVVEQCSVKNSETSIIASKNATGSIVLLLGSRGVELIGGTVVLFMLFLSL